MNQIPIFLPYINRPDLLERMLYWIPTRNMTAPVVINNSGSPLHVPARVLEPPVPLSFTQSQNWMLAEAQRLNVPFYMWGHVDAILDEYTAIKLFDRAFTEWNNGTKWGVIFTYYDIFCAYSTEAMSAVGGYDTAFFDYCSDQDVYRRLDLAGYARLESGLPVGHDKGSTTINTDPAQSRRVGAQVEYRSQYYFRKWGGAPGSERFQTPWGIHG